MISGEFFISNFKQKILIPVGLKLFSLFSFIKNIIVAILLLVQKIFIVIYKLIIKPFFFNSYLSEIRTKNKTTETENTSPSENNKITHWLTSRGNLHLIVIMISILVATGNIQARDKGESDQSAKTILFQMLGNEEEELVQETSLLTGQQYEQETYALSLKADQNLVLNDTQEEAGDEKTIEHVAVLLPNQEVGALIQPSIATTSPAPRAEIFDYTVEEGDVAGSIAEKFGISVSTILWENNLNSRSIIKPGQVLTILPLTGLTHKIESGDILASLAKDYRVETSRIVEYNELEDATDIQIGQTLLIPNGKKPAPIYVAPTPTYASNTPSYNQQTTYSDSVSDQALYNQRIYARPASAYGSHRFPWGQCTWYVAQRRYVPWAGHAKQWIGNARGYGYQIGNSPKVGAIIVTRESWYGHVGYVESVGSGTVTFAESNYKGLGVITRRTLKVGDNRILGYIY